MLRLCLRLSLCYVALFLYAGTLLSIGLSRDWRLRHEDNGAVYSALALAHLRLGLTGTRGHDVFYYPQTGEKRPYGHHPPGLALLLAATFHLTGSEAPWVARSVPIVFHLASIALLMGCLRLLLDRRAALLAGWLMATLPESAYFGRMVGYEPLGLFCVLLQLYGYSVYRLRGRRWSLALLGTGVVLGGLVDWAPLYFSLGLWLLTGVGWLRGHRDGRLWLTLTTAGLGIVVVDGLHMLYAYGSLAALRAAAFHNANVLGQTPVTPVAFVLKQLDIHRRYFSHAGLLGSIGVTLALLRPAWRSLLVPPASTVSSLLCEVMAVSFGAGGAYLLCIAGYAMSHHYSQFYLLPAVIMAMVLTWNALRQLRQGWSWRWQQGLVVVLLCEVMLTSASMLYFRHTHPETYTLHITARLRAESLLPAYPATGRAPGRLL